MKTLLMYVPISDPTSGYHSLCYLKSFANSRGIHDIEIIDTNIEVFLYTLREEEYLKVISYCNDRLIKLINNNKLNGFEQIELHELWRLTGISQENLEMALSVMRSEEKFFDYLKYRPAVNTLINWLRHLSILAYPGIFENFTLQGKSYFNIYNIEDMTNRKILFKIINPFKNYFTDKLLPMIRKYNYGIIGINVTYVAQLPFSLAIGRMIRDFDPNIKIIFGGTGVSDVWKYILKSVNSSRYFLQQLLV